MTTGFKNITEVKRANKAAGLHWFDRKTVEYHGARVETPILGGFYWVESIYANTDRTGRVYKVAACGPDGDIHYLHGTERFAAKAQAQAIIDAILKSREVEES